MALTLRGNGQVSSDNYGIDSDGSITATGITATGITSTGNVGIGTASPETRLDVRSATATYLTVGNTTDNTSGLDTGIIFKQIGNIGNPATIQVIGNLSPTSGSAYTAGFKFKTGDWNGSVFSSVDAMTIAASGYVTTPNQPSFFAYLNGTDFTGVGLVPFNSTTYNTGNHFNTSNGRFTVPVTGVYMFTVIMTSGTVQTARHQFLAVNGSRYRDMFEGDDFAVHSERHASVYLRLTANDVVDFRNGVTMTVQGGNYNHNSAFMGHFLG